MESRRCSTCNGSGQIMGGGMMYHDCDECNGRGKIKKPIDEISYLQVKESEAYQNAIDEIKSIDKSLTHEEADKLLQKQFKRRERVKK